jgi:hypothetical protein
VNNFNTGIRGEIVDIDYGTNEVVIRDLHSEYEHPEDQLIYRLWDLTLYSRG